MKTGKIYLIRNLINGKGYVGQTKKSLFSRFTQHKRDAEKGSELALHRAIRKHGFENFEIQEVASCDLPLLDDLEKHYVKFFGTYAPTGHGYNLTKGGSTGSRERVVSEEARANLVSVHAGNSYAKGHKVSDEARALMSAAHKGKSRPISEDQKERISATLKGHPVSAETRDKISVSQKGKKRSPLSDVAKKKIGDKNRGRKLGPLTEDQKLQRSIAMKGKKKSPESIAKRLETIRDNGGFSVGQETRDKISSTLSGRKLPEEHKAKISAGLKRAHAKNNP